ncbi:50S ribosomal protein L28 [Thermodesulfobacterium sp. TA1]|uniref:50S ribosomal protein L28 n=1 Tax=Thermodesulfobacterium sp. TA1 TaxID=2234087 RepID=UPI001231E2A7|nr:50S ribosomal protein L28 [Thermodesulfobacterium sp. TA1]QER41728.1 50S ribosomal protein L28 [Thermodesulfobacterium sp. TA1]
MSKICEICGRKPQAGNQISHSAKKSSRWWYPNIQSVRVKLENGQIKRMKVCTRCLKAGKVKKAVS